MSFWAMMQVRNGPAHTLKVFRLASRGGLEDAVEHWHAKMMPGHFTVAGGRKYNYQPRKGDDEPPVVPSKAKRFFGKQRTVQNRAYSWQKRRRKGHNKPLVWNGDSEKDARTSVKISSRRRSAGGLIQGIAAMSLSRYFYARRKDLSQPDKVDELTRTTPDERDELLLVARNGTDRRLASAPTHTETRKAS